MGKKYEFESEIIGANRGGAFVKFPYDAKKEFGKGRVRVHVTFDGIPYDGSLVNMGVKNDDGSICYIVGILKEIRKKIAKDIGDKVSVTLEELH